MTEEQIKEIARSVYREEQTSGQFSPTKIPLHTHNGLDNGRINLRDVVYNNKTMVAISSTDGGGTVTFSNGIANPSALYFYGIATDGSGNRASITGSAQLGNCSQATSTVNSQTSFTTLPVIQANSSVSNNGSTTKVNADDENLATAYDISFVPQGYIRVVSFTNASITLTSSLNGAWSITGFLIIT